jgi:hypothetical protein
VNQYITQEQLQDLYDGIEMSGSDDRLHGCREDRLEGVLKTFEEIAPHVTQTTVLRGELERRRRAPAS